MRFSLAIPAVFALGSFAAPVSDCDSLKSLAVLNGAKLFCAAKYPSASAAPTVEKPKSNAKRFKEDDDRVIRVLSSMPEARQKAFCACYPATASNGTTVPA